MYLRCNIDKLLKRIEKQMIVFNTLTDRCFSCHMVDRKLKSGEFAVDIFFLQAKYLG